MHQTPRRAAYLSLLLALSLSPLLHAARVQEPAPDEPSGVLVHKPGVQPGHTLLAPLGSTETFLIDLDGEIVHTWGAQLAPSGTAYLLDNGNLMRAARDENNKRFRGGGIGGRLQLFSWDSELLWDYALLDDKQTQHHDVSPLPNGNWLVIVWQHHTAQEAIAAGRDSRVVVEDGLWSDSILEIKPHGLKGGEVVWQWNSWDHLIHDFDADLEGYGSIPDHPERIDINGDHRDMPPISEAERERMEELARQMAALGYTGGDDSEDGEQDKPGERGQRTDWLHTNALDYNAEQDLIVISTPHMNEVWVIDHSTSSEQAASSSGGRWKRGGDLLCRWGNPRNYGAGSDGQRRLFYQHDPSWQAASEDGGLRLLLFNNGGGRPGGDFSTVIELELPFDPQAGFLREKGKAFGPKEPSWSFGELGVLFSPFISGAQRLANGNTLICEGASGRLIEVSSSGEVLWEYVNECYGEPAGKSEIAPSTKRGALFRATRVDAR